ncbi:MAG TPA: galactose-1-phosphate uridylyltransferase [Myxococcales bacterium]|nr:MAG: galactose-1-phosphate uridylyltransferase [Deltaproteobacteria bacterium]HMC35555.1 galactose-1-phosphate uridylyltransferase [Myxococcales bacterium]
MPELRRDPVVGRWVIVAPERADRPNAVVRTLPDQDDPASCPFCPGHEAITPPELLVRRDNAGPPNGPGWTLRVVPNRFPALRTEERMVRAGLGMYDAMGGVGAHEVIIETPEHARAMPQQSPEQVEQVLRAAQERILDLSRDVRLRSVLFFKNSGAASGATLSHPHSQIVALPLVPTELQQELAGAERHYEEKERCIFCDILAQEARERSRVVLETDGFMALSPWAARGPFELLVLPREHRSIFEQSTAAELRGLSEALRLSLRKLDLALGKPAYNFYLHTLPLREPPSDWYHWHLELRPILALAAGFEWGSGLFVNPTPPEEAAAFLRQTEA